MGEAVFPNKITVNNKTYTKVASSQANFSGLNPKAFYEDSDGQRFILKIEKERKLDAIFKPTLKPTEKAFFEDHAGHLQQHVNELRDAATATSVIASQIAGRIFGDSLVVPENILCRITHKGVKEVPAVLSKIYPEEWHFDEFPSKAAPVKTKKQQLNDEKKKMDSPAVWAGNQIKMEALELKETQALILGKLYYTALLMGHWDLLNNINLSNAGAVTKHGEVQPTIVDWGNCLGIGFGGFDQDSTAFLNPEFKGLAAQESNLIEGFTGSVPFDKTVYPKLPRQVVADLFHLDPKSKNPILQKMLKGFNAQHHIALAQQHHIHTIVDSTIHAVNSNIDERYKKSLRGTLLSELGEILKGRLASMTDIISQLEQRKNMQEIAANQFKKIVAGQNYK